MRVRRSRLIVVAALIAAGTLTLTVAAASGVEIPRPTSIPDSAFSPVTLPAPPPGTLPAPAVLDDIPILRDPSSAASSAASAPSAAPRAQPKLPASNSVVVTVKPPAPKLTHSISGTASWYCYAGVSPCTIDHPDDGGIDAYAAAGPRLRAAIGSDWRGKIVYVDGLRVQLIDWCECHKGESIEKLLDLYHDVYVRTGSAVRVRW